MDEVACTTDVDVVLCSTWDVEDWPCTTDVDGVLCAACEVEELPCDRDVVIGVGANDVEDEVELAPFAVCTCEVDEIEPADDALFVICKEEGVPCINDEEDAPCTDDVEELLCICAANVELWPLVVTCGEKVVLCCTTAAEEVEDVLDVKV